MSIEKIMYLKKNCEKIFNTVIQQEKKKVKTIECRREGKRGKREMNHKTNH